MAFQFYFGLAFVVFLDEDCILRGVLSATENVHLQALQRTENYGRYLCSSKCQENASENTWSGNGLESWTYFSLCSGFFLFCTDSYQSQKQLIIIS